MCSIHSLHHNFFSISLWSEIFSRTVCTLCRLSLKSAVKYKFWQKDLSSPSFLKKVTLIFARRAPCKPFNHGKRIAANLDKTIHLAGAAFNQGGKQWSHSARNPPNFWLLIAPKPLTPSIRLLLARTLPCFVNLGALSPFCSTISTVFPALVSVLTWFLVCNGYLSNSYKECLATTQNYLDHVSKRLHYVKVPTTDVLEQLHCSTL